MDSLNSLSRMIIYKEKGLTRTIREKMRWYLRRRQLSHYFF